VPGLNARRKMAVVQLSGDVSCIDYREWNQRNIVIPSPSAIRLLPVTESFALPHD
jgi:hypothetical protein